MIRINSESELLSVFRPVDREEVILTNDIEFPLVLKDYFTWTEPSGHRVYLIFQDPAERGGAMWGVVFKRSQATIAEPSMQMCQWCHSVRSGNSVTLMTAAVTPRRRVGVHICRDLSCKEKVLSLPGVHDLREPYGAFEKLFRVLYRMSDFVKYSLLETKAEMASKTQDGSKRAIH